MSLTTAGGKRPAPWLVLARAVCQWPSLSPPAQLSCRLEPERRALNQYVAGAPHFMWRDLAGFCIYRFALPAAAPRRAAELQET
jgi:hypothetical protein